MSTDIDERVTKALDSIAELTLAIPDFIGMMAAQNVKPNMTQKERDDLIGNIKWMLSKVPDTTKFLSDYATILAVHQNCKAAKENIQTAKGISARQQEALLVYGYTSGRHDSLGHSCFASIAFSNNPIHLFFPSMTSIPAA
jgi:hypothetical protein